MKTFIANETLLLIDGEVCLIEELSTDISNIDTSLIIDHNDNMWLVIASTKQLPNLKQLPREVFVKENKITNAYENIPDNIKKYINYVSFEAGYNANKNEYTQEDIQSAIIIAYNAGKENKSESKANEFIMKHLRPLTLPQSITTNDELEIISVSWK